MSRIIGIDLGTTFSEVAVIEHHNPVVIPVDGDRLMPSVVGLSAETGEILVGWPARNQLILDPENTIRSIKRKMGSNEKVRLGDREYLPQEISALILRRLKLAAETYLQQPVTQAVITVPAHFSDAQRQATKDAGGIAGLEVVRIINEPTAAALAFGLDRQDHQKIMVYDLGGGTFDVSIVEINNGVIEVLSSHGNLHLGGDDFDQRLVDHFALGFKQLYGIDLRETRRSLSRVMAGAEKAKITMSSQPFAQVLEEFIAQKNKLPLNLVSEIPRYKFEELIGDLMESTARSMKEAMKAANLQSGDIERVLLVGGSTRIPMVWDIIEREIGKPPHAEVDPDMAVALGAAVQAGIVAGEEIDAVLVDVAPHSLGIEVADVRLGMLVPDVFSCIIKKNTPIPTTKSEVYYTLHDNQQTVDIRIYQGESPIASSNTRLGKFMVEGLIAAPAGDVHVLVNFDYDINGIVHITAQEKGSSVKKNLSVSTTRPGMTDEEIERARQSTEEFLPLELEPMLAREVLPEVQQRVEGLLMRAREVSKQITGIAKKNLEAKIKSLEKAIDSSEGGEIARREEELIDMMYHYEAK
ncbi:MAG: Hsp70 family protein [Acidobacteria bacterium]|nr:Hsp70 family protein [Acidobacteriota bacterium]MBI3656919.1 Hsp70 family protein [Acidobacteriota bacterium]